jgi:hypothetical protein
MRKIIFICSLLFLLVLSGVAQNSSEPETIISDSAIINGFGGPLLMLSSIHNNFALIMGGGGGVSINDFFVGGFGFGQTSQIKAWDSNVIERKLSMSGGGLWLGYSFMAKKKLHPSIDVIAGWGSINFYRLGSYSSVDEDNIGMGFLIPHINLELNVTQYLRVTIGAEYRSVFLTKVDEEMTNSDFNSFGCVIGVKFGAF